MILALGSSGFVLQGANALVNFFLNNQINALGALSSIGADGALAALGVVGRISLFIFFPILGVSMAVQPLFGYNYGARNFVRVKKIFNVSLLWAAVLGFAAWVLIHLFPEPMVALFNIQGDLLAFTVNALKVQVFLIPLVGLHVLATNYFQASGQPLKAMFLSLTRQVLFLIPLIYLLPLAITNYLPGFEALDGLYYAFPVSDGLAILTCLFFIVFEFKKLNKAIREQDRESG
jgi:Na+-driven multidrug efflux pump